MSAEAAAPRSGLTRRIIPCLDVTDGRVVKGVQFAQLRDAGDPVEVAQRYNDEGADELTFLDITASSDRRDIILGVIEAVASRVFIPLTVGGGVRSVADVRRLLNAGADKVSINTAGIQDPTLIAQSCERYGSQAIVCAIDAKRRADGQGWEVHTHGGRQGTGLDVVQWARRVQQLGAGEILLTSMDRDGTRAGFDLELTRAVSDAVDVPVIASGGVGNLEHLVDGVSRGGADAVLAASIFHFGEFTVQQAKQRMAAAGLPVRLPEQATTGGWIDALKLDAQGLIPAIAQDASSGRVLMVAWMNRESLRETWRSGHAVYWSRSRSRLWHKGEESGHRQRVREIRVDCDQDVVLLQVEQVGGIACHTGRQSCFFQRLEDGRWLSVDPVLASPESIYGGAPSPRTPVAQGPADGQRAADAAIEPATAGPHDTLARLADVVDSRRNADAGRSYVASLFKRGDDAILKKIGEEATETVMAAKDHAPERIVSETADLWFHCLVMLSHFGLRPEAVLQELQRREGLSGLDEKSLRKAGQPVASPQGAVADSAQPPSTGASE